jgi:MFS family permease
MIYIIAINFLLAIATTVAMTILPLITTEKLGLSLLVFGLIEGGTEFIANVFRLVSGSLFDRIKNKKNIFISATIMAFLSKLMLSSPSAFFILSSKIFERLSNGLFGAPRDAFVGQTAKNKGLGLAFLSCSKTLGCVSGPVLVTLSVYLWGDLNSQLYNLVFFSAILVFIAIILSFMVKTKSFTIKENITSFLLSRVKKIALRLTPILAIAGCFFLARFNDGLILIHLKKAGLPEWFYLSTIGIFNTIMFVASPILGIMVDRKKTKIALFITISSLILFNIFSSLIEVNLLVMGSLSLAAWGVQRVGAQITFTALIFQNISNRFYGTAIGIYSILTGMGNLIASSITGYLAADSFKYVFLYSGAWSFICLILASFLLKRIK